MIQLKAAMIGIAVVGSICYALYTHFKNREQEQKQSYRHRPPPSKRNADTHVTNTSSALKKECSICLSPITPSTPFRFLNCLHVFHEECINSWLKIKGNCPNCRTKV